MGAGPKVRLASARLLDKVIGSLDPVAQAWHAVVTQNWERAVALGGPSVKPLCELLEDEAWAVRRAAAEALLAILRDGNLDPLERQKILEYQREIVLPHQDHHQPSGHVDTGIGVSWD